MERILSVPPGDILMWFVVFLFACAFHESAHAWTSDRFGDPTARYQGRITLNPIPHIDPIGTILIPLMGFISGGVAMFGWAKFTPVNPLLWRDKVKANIWVSAAGPISNFLLATLGFVAIKALLVGGVVRQPFLGDVSGPFNLVVPTVAGGVMEPIATLLSIFLILNITLGVFNLFPIPPLDGSHVLESLLPYEMAKAYEQIRPWGFILLLAFIWTPIPGWILRPIFRGVAMLLFA
ncbi:MAG TPA: site-2 protease family protein [Blastocatellia bacterium]|nr:site-2 protease family protein [Blastocatellia bacterium]